MTEDENLQLRVLKELEWDPKLDAARIGVAARNGVVTLTGEVPSYAEKVAAEEAARRVKGVRGLAQAIEVHLPHERRRSDTDIAERALRILAWEVVVPDERIAVEVAHGWVSLRGEVDWHHQRVAAEDAVRKLSGVRGITNVIAVKPSTKAADVRKRIEEAFGRHAALEAGRAEAARPAPRSTTSPSWSPTSCRTSTGTTSTASSRRRASTAGRPPLRPRRPRARSGSTSSAPSTLT